MCGLRLKQRPPTTLGRLLGGLPVAVLVAFFLLPGDEKTARAQEDVLGQMDRQVAAIVERVKPSVVSVRAARRAPPLKLPASKEKQSARDGDAAATVRLDTADGANVSSISVFQRSGAGSLPGLFSARVGTGFVVDRDGLILTTADVVGGSDQVTVRLASGQEVDGKVLGRDATTGVAVIKVEGQSLPSLRLAEEARVVPGQWAIIVGNQLDRPHSVWVGTVARDDVTLPPPSPQGKLLQIYAPVGPGASGAPVFNSRGEVIGVVVATTGGRFRLGQAFDAPWEKAMAALRETLGRENPEWQRHLQRIIEEATRRAREAMERAHELRKRYEEKAPGPGREPNKPEAEPMRLEQELERIDEELNRQIEAVTGQFEADLERAVARSLQEAGVEASVGQEAEQPGAQIEKQHQGAEPNPGLEARIRKIREEIRRLGEEMARRSRALQEQYDREARRVLKGRGGTGRERERLQDEGAREEARLREEIARRMRALQDELERLHAALPPVRGARRISVNLPPELAKVADETRALTDAAAIETTLNPNPLPVSAPNPVPTAAPEVQFWAGRTPGDGAATYAIPIERVKWAMAQIREHGRVVHPFLGVELVNLGPGDRERLKAPEGYRARVANVLPDSPAQQAGMRKDDVILEFGSRKIEEASDLTDLLMTGARVGERVSLVVWREGRRVPLQVTLKERPAAAPRALRPEPFRQRPARPPAVGPPVGSGSTMRTIVRADGGVVAVSAVGSGWSAKVSVDARDVELEAFLRELSRATTLEFRAEGPVARRQITLKVENVSVEDLIESLNRLYSLRAERRDNTITFRAR